MDDPRRYAPAVARNRQAILDVLRRVLPADGLTLEVASGSGEHAAFLAPQLALDRPALRWQPTDFDADALAGIDAHTREADAAGTVVLPAKRLDATASDWPVDRAAATVCINMIHISPWAACEGLMRGAGRILTDDGVLYLYGPFKRDGDHTAPSNEAFDASLKARNRDWGVRDLEAVAAAAGEHGLDLVEIVEMPANNLSLIFRKGRVAA